jgi:hypothetical protein
LPLTKVPNEMLDARISSATAVSASGTAVNFSDLPSWVKRITVQFTGVSLSGSADMLLQIGDASGVSTTGYAGTSWYGGSSITSATLSAGFFAARLAAAANVAHGTIVLTNITGNTWVASGGSGLSNTAGNSGVNGSLTLAAALQRVRLTTTNGTDTFDAGTVNIMYEA